MMVTMLLLVQEEEAPTLSCPLYLSTSVCMVSGVCVSGLCGVGCCQ